MGETHLLSTYSLQHSSVMRLLFMFILSKHKTGVGAYQTGGRGENSTGYRKKRGGKTMGGISVSLIILFLLVDCLFNGV